MSMLDEAFRYAKHNLAVFPIEPHGKKPLTEHGCKDATTNQKMILTWWKRWPTANIGIATGSKSGGIYVIDLDKDDDRGIDGYLTFRDWERENDCFPESWRSITGRGGYHMFFKSNRTVKNKTGLLDGVDIRGEGGYVVAPPSIHQNGRMYEWEVAPEDVPLAEADDLLNKLLQSGQNPERPDKAFEVPKVIPKGQRNDQLFKAACSYQEKGLPDSAIMGAVVALNQNNCETPLPEDEVKRLVESALKYDKGPTKKPQVEDDGEPHFKYTKKGVILQTTWNVVEAITHDPQLKDSLRFNVLAYSPYICGNVPWTPEKDKNIFREWDNFDDDNFNSYIEDKYGLLNRTKIAEGFKIVIGRNRFNPVCDMLSEIHETHWDHKYGHIENLLPDYLGVEKNEYSIESMKLFMIGAISRAFHPGCKFDYTPVLMGDQGIGKSTFVAWLAMNRKWYCDNFNTIEGDKAFEKLRGMWIVEFAELLAAKRAKEIESIKAFLTSTTDSYRPPYERQTEQRPRMCVFIGTTNDENFLTDRTGNRRYLPMRCRKDHIKKSLFDNPAEIRADFENAWGEAMDLFIHWPKDKPLELPREIIDYAESFRKQFTEEDARVGVIQQWLDDNPQITRVCSGMLYQQALGELGLPTRHESNDLLTIMSQEISGWRKMPRQEKCGVYGKTTCYEKVVNNDENLEKSKDADTELPPSEGGFTSLNDCEKVPFD